MFIYRDGFIGDPKTGKEEEVKATIVSRGTKQLMFSGLLVVAALVKFADTAFKNGFYAHGDAYNKALFKLGLLTKSPDGNDKEVHERRT